MAKIKKVASRNGTAVGARGAHMQNTPKSPAFVKQQDRMRAGLVKPKNPHAVGPKPNGRGLALRILDDLLSLSRNQKIIQTALQAELEKNPLGFFQYIVMPLIPKEQLVKLEDGDKVPVRITFGKVD